MMMKHKVLVGVLVGIIFTTLEGSEGQTMDCTSYKCNDTDPKCDVIGGRCKPDYRMCCDQKCHYKQAPCRGYLANTSNTNYSQYVRNLNASDYAKELEAAKQKILAWAKDRPCWPEHHCFNKTTCLPQYHHCSNGECKELLSQCGFWWEKNSYSAETNVTCYPDERCFRGNCKNGYWQCDDGECVNEQVVCRGGPDCSDASDEARCDGNCYPPFRCLNGSCALGFFGCGNGECILREQVCDTVVDCINGSDEVNCSGACWPKKACNPDANCKPGYFKCDEDKCLADYSVCDQRPDCKDGTDEIRHGHGFKCVLGQNFDTCVLPQKMVDSDHAMCVDFADNCNANGSYHCFTCLDQKLVIDKKQRCDGVIDCFDMSDECLCLNSEAEELCRSVCLAANSNQTNSSQSGVLESVHIPASCGCPPGQFDCGNGVCLDLEQVCNGLPECGTSKADEAHCETTMGQNERTILCPGDVNNGSLITAVLCDGRPECHDLSDECNDKCNQTAMFCNIKKLFKSKSGPFEFLCDKTALYFDVRKICDGKWSPCSPRIFEEETGCPSRHYCQNGEAISIDKNLVCDGILQCDDKSDELNCTDRFYCENQVPFSVPIKSKLDGKPDCSDSSDECPKDLDENVLSSRKELLGSAGFRATTWIIAIFATVGNLVTFIGTVKDLCVTKRINPITKTNYILLLNLSVADCLMGIYLLSLSVKSTKFSGQYCRYDKSWRTGATCAGIGGLALTSSQVSVIILVFLTTLRLYSVLNPTKTNDIGLKIPTIALCFAWFISILIGVLPRSPVLADYFVSEVWIPTNFTNLESRSKESMFVFVQRLAALHPIPKDFSSDSSWYSMVDYLQQNYPEIKIKGFFGYFSDNSVCLPKFFASVGEPGWGYSAGIIIFNFLAFIYVCIAYWIIFRTATRNQVSQTRTKRMKELQGRVVRLVITDFCCWVPICIMSFIHLSGTSIPDTAYAVSAVILLPINSALNPFLYSDITSKYLRRLYRKVFRSEEKSDTASCPTGSTPRQQNPGQSDDDVVQTVRIEENTV